MADAPATNHSSPQQTPERHTSRRPDQRLYQTTSQIARQSDSLTQPDGLALGGDSQPQRDVLADSDSEWVDCAPTPRSTQSSGSDAQPGAGLLSPIGSSPSVHSAQSDSCPTTSILSDARASVLPLMHSLPSGHSGFASSTATADYQQPPSDRQTVTGCDRKDSSELSTGWTTVASRTGQGKPMGGTSKQSAKQGKDSQRGGKPKPGGSPKQGAAGKSDPTRGRRKSMDHGNSGAPLGRTLPLPSATQPLVSRLPRGTTQAQLQQHPYQQQQQPPLSQQPQQDRQDLPPSQGASRSARRKSALTPAAGPKPSPTPATCATSADGALPSSQIQKPASAKAPSAARKSSGIPIPKALAARPAASATSVFLPSSRIPAPHQASHRGLKSSATTSEVSSARSEAGGARSEGGGARAAMTKGAMTKAEKKAVAAAKNPNNLPPDQLEAHLARLDQRRGGPEVAAAPGGLSRRDSAGRPHSRRGSVERLAPKEGSPSTRGWMGGWFGTT